MVASLKSRLASNQEEAHLPRRHVAVRRRGVEGRARVREGQVRDGRRVPRPLPAQRLPQLALRAVPHHDVSDLLGTAVELSAPLGRFLMSEEPARY